MKNRLSALRRKTAIEAATLLYRSYEKEYKQAKEKAARILRTRNLPSNLEIAEQIDIIAENSEGQARLDRLIVMRKEAISIMNVLKNFSPRLIGSVWRGTAHKNSDIDIEVFSSDPNKVYNALEETEIDIKEIEHSPRIRGTNGESMHVRGLLTSGHKVEIIIREDIGKKSPRKCEIYGDSISGLNYSELEEIMKKNPVERFLPQ
jgi:predicted nucleotidyltransferase